MRRTESVVETVRIRASPEKVFRFFTEPASLVQWLGESAELQPRPGGSFVVTIGGETIRGEYAEVEPPHRLRVTWGRDGSTALPPGSSELDITLEGVDGGTLVTLSHRGLPVDEISRHRAGWQHFLPLLAQRASSAQGEPT